jgi:hypothetical protein
VAAVRTDETGRPAQPLQVVQAVGVGLEPRLELAEGTRVVNACDGISMPVVCDQLRLNGYPIAA